MQRRRTGVDRHGVGAADRGGELLLESADARPRGQPAGMERGHDLGDLGLRHVRSEKRDLQFGHGFSIGIRGVPGGVGASSPSAEPGRTPSACLCDSRLSACCL